MLNKLVFEHKKTKLQSTAAFYGYCHSNKAKENKKKKQTGGKTKRVR